MSYRRGWIALLLFALALINYIDRVTLSFAATLIAREYGLSPVLLGYLFSSFLWTYTLFLLPMGLLVDRFGAKWVAGFGLGVWSLATASTGMAGSFAALLSTRLVMGAGEASSNPAGARVIREWLPVGERGLVNAIFNSGSYAGPAICALVAGPVIALFGWRALFFVAGGIGLLWLACWLIWFDKPERACWLGEAERAKILAERSISKTFVDGETAHPGLLQLLGRGPTLWGLALTQGCNVYAQYLFLTWLPSYLQQSKGLTLATTGAFAAIPYAVAVVLCILIGRLSDRFLAGDVGGGKRRIVIASAMVLASTILLAPLLDSVWLILALISLSLAGIAATTAMNFALLNDLLPDPRNVGLAMAFLVVGGNAFGLMAPIVTGYVIDLTGSFDMAFVIAGILLLAGATSVMTLTHRPIGVACKAVTA
jgi:MFS family permease